MSIGMRLGDATIFRVVEQHSLFNSWQFFPSLTLERLSENAHWLRPRYFDNKDRLILCIQSYVVRTPSHVVVIDTCVGNHKSRPLRPGDPTAWNMMRGRQWESGLASIGIRVEDVDYVMCTHLHVDHVGWNTRLEDGRWTPTFPNARYIFSARELRFWTEREQSNPHAFPWITDSVLPVLAANRAQLVTSDYALNDLVTLMPTPGHTIDHYSVRIGRRGEAAIIAGDMAHSPLQVRYPELGMFADFDIEQARATRERVFGNLCESEALFCSGHFPGQSIGRIVRAANSYEFAPIDGPWQ